MPRPFLPAIVLALATVAPAAGLTASVYAPSWSATHADAANSDYSPVAGPKSLSLAWQRQFGGAITLGVTTDAAGRIFLTTAAAGCHLYALDPATGRTIWCSDTVGRLAVISAPLVDKDNRLFVPDSEAMHAFDREGRLLWRSPIDGVPLSCQFTPKGRLIFVTNIGNIYILERTSGKLVIPPTRLIPEAEFDPRQDVLACARGTAACPSANTPAIDLVRGRLYFTFWTPGAKPAGVRAMALTEGKLTALTPLWVSDVLVGGSGSSPTLSPDGSRLYVTDNGGNLASLDATTGKVMWTHPIGYNAGGSVSVSPSGIILPAGGDRSPLMGFVDIGAKPKLLWRRDDLQNRGIATQAAGGLAYATVSTGSRHNDIAVIDTATGREIDRAKLPGATGFSVGTAVGPEGQVYVSTIRGGVFAFRAK